jgi:hypothetical protein
VVPSAGDFRKASVEAGRTVETLAFVDRGWIRPRSFATPRSPGSGRPGRIRTRPGLAQALPQESSPLMSTLRADELKARAA